MRGEPCALFLTLLTVVLLNHNLLVVSVFVPPSLAPPICIPPPPSLQSVAEPWNIRERALEIIVINGAN